jgi:hypothetical protein
MFTKHCKSFPSQDEYVHFSGKFEVFTAVTMKNSAFWDVMPCGSSEELSVSFIKVTRIGELGTTLAVTSHRRTLQRNTKFLCSVRRWLVTASVVSTSPILVTLKKETLSSSQTSVLTRSTLRNIPQDAILHVLTLVFVSTIMVHRFLTDTLFASFASPTSSTASFTASSSHWEVSVCVQNNQGWY